MKKTLITLLLIASIGFSAFADYNHVSYFSLGAKFNLGTKQGSKQISSIEVWESYDWYGEFRSFTEKASLLHSYENKNNNTFSLDFTYMPKIKNKSEKWEFTNTDFNVNFLGSNEHGSFQGKTLSFKGAFTVETADHGFDETYYGTSAQLGYTYSFDHNIKESGLSTGISLTKHNEEYNSLLTKEEQYAIETLEAKATFHLIDKEIRISDGYVGGNLTYFIDHKEIKYQLGYKHSYDQNAYVNGLYSNLLFNNTEGMIFVSENCGLTVGFGGEVSLHLINGDFQFQINNLSLNGGIEGTTVMAYELFGTDILLSGIEYRYSPANDPSENGVFAGAYTKVSYEPRAGFEIETSSDVLFHFGYDGDSLKTKVEKLSIESCFEKSSVIPE